MHRVILKENSTQALSIHDILDNKKLGKVTKKGTIKLKKKYNKKQLKKEIACHLSGNKQAWQQKYLNFLSHYNHELSSIENYQFPAFSSAIRLKKCSKDMFNRQVYLHPAAKKAWKKMQKKAQAQGIDLQIISAYRSLAYQKKLILNKLAKGIKLTEILKVNTLPGFSQHHTGCAIDIGSKNAAILEETFDQSQAFSWLKNNASQFNFYLTYPKNNTTGICYEPWHWCYCKWQKTYNSNSAYKNNRKC